MSKLSLELYPPVDLPAFPPTWEDVERLSLSYPVVRHAVVMVHRGDWTREQALIMLAFALAKAFQQLFSKEVDRLARMPPDVRVLIPAKPGYRIVFTDRSRMVYEHCETGERIPIEQSGLSFDRNSFDCPGYKRSDYGKEPTCKYCGLPQESHTTATKAGAVGQR